ncbi:HNH endonuclease signature motif containing protein [Archangium violaceum]|uniref:HNH endonuclease signature motif containing protein n=1 Tax=Archangium violaceum TaxID=83451 RepID=UPI0036DB2F67
MRKVGTTSRGGPFSQSEINAVWEKGSVVTGKPADQYRKDACGALMKKDQYGNTSSPLGWEIDHRKPVAKGGGDELSNLQPLQWENNRHKSDDYPNWACAVRG